jgi:processive 1,2-diacylglycerol beta-glucosyltransferase
MTDLVVVYSPVGGGHKAAALATAEAARARGLSVELVDAFAEAPPFVGDAYLGAHLAGQGGAPAFYGQMYFASNRRGDALEPLRLGLDNLLFRGVAERIAELAPRAIVATHHLPLVVLGHERRKGKLAAPVVGVVTDYTAHACWAERGIDAWAVPFGPARDELAAHGVPRERIVGTGIPVKSAFEEIGTLREPAGRLRALVTSGGFGVGPMTRIVRSFAGIPAMELTVVCGAAKELATRIAHEAKSAGVRANVLGFEKDMAARVAACHVVVGKAGGLTVSESLTAGRPMVIASAIPGNEELNARYVTRGGAAAAAEPDDVGRVVAELRDRRVLASMGMRARALVPNGAAAAIVELALAMSGRTSRAA